MNNCQDYFVWMNEYLDGELPQAQTDELLRHLESCGHCREQFERLQQLTGAVRGLDAEPPETLHAAIMRRVRRERAMRRRRVLGRLGGLAACLVLLVALAEVAMPRLGQGASSDSANNMTGSASAPEAALFSPQENARAADDSVTQDTAADGAANEESSEAAPREYESTGKTTMANQSNDGYDHALLTVPQLAVSEPAAFYVVAVGEGDLSDVFGQQAVTEQDADEAYALVENADGAQAQAEQRLIDAGFTVCDNVEGLPETDENAENGLVIVYESR